jgi:hypothetical protein
MRQVSVISARDNDIQQLPMLQMTFLIIELSSTELLECAFGVPSNSTFAHSEGCRWSLWLFVQNHFAS